MTGSRTTLLARLAAGAAVVGSLALIPAGHADAKACAGGYEHVYRADFLKVHKTPNSAAVVGQLPNGAAFCITSVSKDKTGGYYWDGGYGYNGSTKLTGYVAAYYLH